VQRSWLEYERVIRQKQGCVEEDEIAVILKLSGFLHRYICHLALQSHPFAYVLVDLKAEHPVRRAEKLG
jgi:hypothetical protein